MKQWFNNLQSREQQLVGTMAVVCLAALVYWGVWLPTSERLARAEAGVKTQQKLLSWVEQQADEVIRLRRQQGTVKPTSQGSLNQIANQSAARFNLNLTRLQPQGDSLQIWIETANFIQLLNWLQMLQRDHRVIIASVDLAADDKPGMVNVRRLVLTR